VLDREREYQAAFSALAELAIKDMALAAESFRARQAGDHAKAEAADAARAALLPIKLEAEENFLRAQIAAAKADRDSFARSLRSDVGDLPLQQIEGIIASFTRTFDDEASDRGCIGPQRKETLWFSM